MTSLMKRRADRAGDIFVSPCAAAVRTCTVFVMLCMALGLASSARAGSTDAVNPSFQIGSGTVTGLGTTHVTVNQASQLAKIHWDSLGNKAGEVLQYNQPSTGSVALNIIGGADSSHFLGSVFANGSVIFVNPNGVFFGPQSQVNVGGLIASSLNLTDANFVSGRYAFDGSSAAGMVRNEGQITAGPYGVYLLAPNVSNSGIITTPGGQIALGAGTTAYLSTRADGRGFLTEVTAPTGDVLNVGRMIADGGQVSMIGRLVTQSGLVQANTVQKQNGVIKLVASDQATLSAGSQTVADGGEIAVSGRIIEQQGLVRSGGIAAQSGRVEFVATEQVNLRAGSQTIVKGGDGDVIDGGTIAAMATNPTNGTVTIESGAVLDVSGGASGGHGGELWVGGMSAPSTVSFLGMANAGYDPGVLRTVSRARTVTTADLTGGTSRSYLNFYALDDLTVNVAPQFNLASRTIIPALDGSARTGTLRFFAGNNLIVEPSVLQNGNRNPTTSTSTANPWNLVGTAVNDVLFQPQFGQSTIWSTGKGSITLQAGRDIKLTPDGGGGATTIQTFDGDINITAGRDVVAPSTLINSQYSGIRLDRVVVNATDPSQGAGNLFLSAGGSLIGGKVNGVDAGPGFVLSNGTARVRVGGNIGSSSEYATFTVGSAGVPLTGNIAAPIANSQTVATLDVVAQGNVYVGNVQDRGVSEGLRTPTFNASTVNQNSSVSFIAVNGDIHLRPVDISSSRTSSHLLPPTFAALAQKGNLFIESNLEFWSSPVGSLNFLAGQSILGRPGAGDGMMLNCPLSCNPITDSGSETTSPITLTALGGDISDLTLNFVDSYLKVVNVTAKNNIRNISGVFAVPEFTDGAGNAVPAVTITAQTGIIDFSGLTSNNAGFLFGGTGWAKVSAHGNLELGVSQGLVFQLDPHQVTDASNVNVPNAGGLLDLAVGGSIAMTKSKIQSNNGASLFIHGLDAQLPVSGSTATATTATVGGSSVYVVNGQPVLDVTGSPVVVGANDTIAGHSVLVVNGKAVLGVNGKPIVVDDATSNVIMAGDLVHGTAVLDRPLVQLTDGTIVAVINGKTVYGTLSGAAGVNGRPRVDAGGVILTVGGKQVRVVEPVGGAVDVGTSDRSINNPDDKTGILTVRGGAIDLKATGNIDVNLSRIATLGGGNISLTSTTGNINAGNGSRDDVTSFVIEQPGPNGSIFRSLFKVPGSGIFTIHPDDGDLPNIPPFDPLSPFHKQVIMHQFLGHDVSNMLPLVPAADEAWKNQYDQSVRQLFAGFKLGDITLKASHDVIVPPAGIRGRNITIEAGHNLDLQGGMIRGISTVNVGAQILGSLNSFVGAFVGTVGSGSTVGLGNITGTVGSVTTTPSVTASVSTASLTSTKAADDAKSSQPVGEPKAVADRGNKQGGQEMAAGSLRVRDKVKIRVETKQEQAM